MDIPTQSVGTMSIVIFERFIMSLVAIKGIYQNGQITLEEEITAKEPIAVIVTFLEEKKTETVTEFAQWFASMSAFSDDFMVNGREQPELQERDWSVFE